MKKIVSFVLSITLLITTCFCVNLKTYASNNNYSATYKTPETVEMEMTFDIYNIDVRNGTFTGHYSIFKDVQDIDKEISGTVKFYKDHYKCNFSFKYKWLFATYDTVFYVDVYPLTGRSMLTGGGGILVYTDVELFGTKNMYYNQTMSYSKNDMAMCMKLSKSIYGGDDEEEIRESVADIIKNNDYNLDNSNIIIRNALPYDCNPDNVEFAILNRKDEINNSIDIIVVIRGTLKDEWQGNVQITGKSYDENISVHENFDKAKDSLKEAIFEYYNDYSSQFDEVNLIITGHSRGAAVSNLYAKEATDVMNSGTATDIPVFDNVTAYTFACPNVEKYNSVMENYYYNIYNFWFSTDIVPTVPLTDPTYGWDYWKYGRCYTMDVPKNFNKSFTINFNTSTQLSVEFPVNKDIGNELDTAFSQWPTVDDYYNKQLYLLRLLNSMSEQQTERIYTTLYEFLYNATYFNTVSNKAQGLRALKDLSVCPQLIPLLCFAISNFNTIYTSHDFNTYNGVINGGDKIDAQGDIGFDLYTYDDAIGNYGIPTAETVTVNNEIEAQASIEYNSAEVQKLKSVANYSDNNDILNWNLDDPSTWTGVTWNSDGHIYEIDFSYKWLEGSLDCSDFAGLTKLNVYGNSFTEINLDNDTNLISLDCSYNNLAESGINLTDCIALNELRCDGCGLVALNLDGLAELQALSCSFNNIIALNIENNTKLNYINCQYNYLDLTNADSLYNQMQNLKATNDAYLNYYPQLITDDAVVNSDEMQALEAFAKIGDNNSKLDWLDENGNISIHKVQKNVMFEYDGSQYRITIIDVSNLDVEGELDLSAFTYLEELYCKDAKLESLNISGCTNLNTLNCEGNNLSSLALPSNADSSSSKLIDVNCEYNYLDTSMFTPAIVDNVEAKPNGIIKYINQKGDSSALQGAIEFAKSLKAKDYSADSYANLKSALDECAYYDFDNLYLNQQEIDNITFNLLTKIYELEAYFYVDICSENCTVTASLDSGESLVEGRNSVLYGEKVNLMATPDENCTFVGWYDVTNNIYLSREVSYSFLTNANIMIKGVCVPTASSTLTFATYSNWVAGTVTKTTDEWNNLTSIDDLLPEVPYRYGYSNGRWVYDNNDVLTKLACGENVTLIPEYDEDNTSLPTPPTAINSSPALDLYFKYDENAVVGSFVMAAGFPEEFKIESVGIAFYYQNAEEFDPTDNFTLLLNNKMLAGRFNTDVLEDVYIVNINNMSNYFNWAARGYVTYIDVDGKLKTAYSNQINIINNQEVAKQAKSS